MDSQRVSFDEQAGAYEERAGLPDAVSREVASQILDGVRRGATVVDVGAGTGTLGRHLAQGAVRYVGIDISRPMLSRFGEKALLLQADADGNWPLADHSADVILFSRSAHLLKGDQILAEVLRVAAPGARVLVGRVRRERQSAGEQLKRRLQHMLRDRNLPGKNGERAKRDFLEALVERGAHLLAERVSAEWTEREAPIESIESWKGKAGLGGRVVTEEQKQEILAELSRWAEEQLGDLTTPREVPRHYQLEGAQLGE